MADNPVVLAIRFLLEIGGLVALGLWGWRAGRGPLLKVMLAVGLPLLAAACWTLFGVTGDSRGEPPVAVAGLVRLAIELSYFGLATWAFAVSGLRQVALGFGVVALAENLLEYERISWLFNH